MSVPFFMTWKSYAVVSGAGLVATWLAAEAPVLIRSTAPASTTAPSAAHTETAAVAIQHEADRLRARLDQVAAYREPARNPFRFGTRRSVAAPVRRPEPTITIEDLPLSAEAAAPAFRLTLAGIAEDTVGEDVVRTAIISTPENVLLVKAGEPVGEQYQVRTISAEAVELVRIADGVVVTLRLKP